MTIGEFLEHLRKEKGLTQVQVAEALSVSDRTISAWETGKRLPDVLALADLAEFYGVTADEILHGRRNSDPQPVPQEQRTEELSEDELKIRKLWLVRFSMISFALCGLMVAAIFLVYVGSWYVTRDYNFKEKQPYFIGFFITGAVTYFISFGFLTAFYQIAKEHAKVQARRIYFRALYISALAMIICSLTTFLSTFVPMSRFWIEYLETDGSLLTAIIFAVISFAICFIGNYILHRDVMKTGNNRAIAISTRNRRTLVRCYIYGCIPVFLAVLCVFICALWTPTSSEKGYEGTRYDIVMHLQTITVQTGTEEVPAGEYCFDFREIELTSKEQYFNGFYCCVESAGTVCRITLKTVGEDGRESVRNFWRGELVMVGNTVAYNFRYVRRDERNCIVNSEPLVRISYSYHVSMKSLEYGTFYFDSEYHIGKLGVRIALALVTADILVCLAICGIRYKKVPLELE